MLSMSEPPLTTDSILEEYPHADIYPTAESLFDGELDVTSFLHRFPGQHAASDIDPSFFEASLSKDINAVPLKLEDDKTRTADGERLFIPDAILPYNIASNQGLLLALTRVLVLTNQCTRESWC